MLIKNEVIKIVHILIAGFRAGFSTRELAIITWMGIILMYILHNHSMRQSLIDIVNAACKFLVQPVFQIFIVYQLGLGIVFIRLNIPGFTFASIKDYSILFFFTMIPFLIKVKLDAFWKSFVRSVGLGAIGQFFISTYTLPYWAEMLLVPLIVFLAVVSVIASSEHNSNVENMMNSFFTIAGWILIIHSILALLNAGFKQILTWNYLEGLAIEPITWMINLPLVILAIPMIQYDMIDSFRMHKKNAVRVLLHSVEFLIGRMFLFWVPVQKLHHFVRSVNTGGLRGLKMNVFISPGATVWEVKMIQLSYRYMLMPRTDYKNGNRSIPIRVQCQDAVSLELLIPPYEIGGLVKDFR